MKILVTGGGGYVGGVLIPMLVAKGHEVRVLDSFIYGQAALMDVIGHPRLDIVRGDVRDVDVVNRVVEDVDAIIHLAAIVGAPACHQDPELSRAVNIEGTRHVVAAAEGRPILFPSTGSCYGAVPDVCTEETPISPLSEYGAQKAAAEGVVRRYGGPWMAFRFATVFGASTRPRLDLLINDLAYQAMTLRSLVIYESAFMRTFIHVRDAARAFVWAIGDGNGADARGGPAPLFDPDRSRMVYNIGNPDMNLTKAEVAQAIARRVPGCLLNLAGEGKDADARNYTVDYSRMLGAGFSCEVGFDAGLDEVFRMCRILRIRNPFSNAG